MKDAEHRQRFAEAIAAMSSVAGSPIPVPDHFFVVGASRKGRATMKRIGVDGQKTQTRGLVTMMTSTIRELDIYGQQVAFRFADDGITDELLSELSQAAAFLEEGISALKEIGREATDRQLIHTRAFRLMLSGIGDRRDFPPATAKAIVFEAFGLSRFELECGVDPEVTERAMRGLVQGIPRSC